MTSSCAAALNCLYNIEHRILKESEFKIVYSEQIQRLFEKNYAEPIKEEDEIRDRAWYLAHFAVQNPHKPGKYRIVFDAAGTTGGTSFDDQLYEEPDLLRPLNGILFRFREKRIAVFTAIEEMYLRVKIQAEDQFALMFLWLDGDWSKPPKKYKMTSLIFGTNCSPFLSYSVRDKNAI
ncbi:hypothetical protein EVAR_27408_1 [Eumeta japonica]|uniref:Uncharacterized protein n=1 Tax=Eumeta variegata TaxID=151549 RepID=A0A4C1X511_EUMVA|nr:hypothetical protein EVAR_27408_1 [Eumeta japonica]